MGGGLSASYTVAGHTRGRQNRGVPVHRKPLTLGALAVALAILVSPAVARSEKRAVDVAHSVLKIQVFKSGFFSAFGHDHEIVAPISQGVVETSESAGVEVRV